jgi:hypothetical protein
MGVSAGRFIAAAAHISPPSMVLLGNWGADRTTFNQSSQH